MKTIKPKIAIVDYGMGNLRSVQKALEHVGANARITDVPADLNRADAIVLPGVGAFGQAVKRLKEKKLWEPLRGALKSDKPFMGICLGYQLLFERSEESRGVRGLSHLKGPVVRFRVPKRLKGMKIPHMGWNSLEKDNQKVPALTGLHAKDYFYFVHSFYPEPQDASLVVAKTTYGQTFASVVARGNLIACQFHPEKSGRHGQRLLRNFVQQVSKSRPNRTRRSRRGDR
jgi:imidazole glycerol phosphate synthase glutamine amidotransferase subunit